MSCVINIFDTNSNISLIDMLYQQVTKTSQKIALTDDNGSLNYLEFYQRVIKASQYFSRAQSSDNECMCIGLYCDPCIDMICGAWGILASGYTEEPKKQWIFPQI